MPKRYTVLICESRPDDSYIATAHAFPVAVAMLSQASDELGLPRDAEAVWAAIESRSIRKIAAQLWGGEADDVTDAEILNWVKERVIWLE